MTIAVLMSVYKKEKPEYLDRALKSICDNQKRKPNQIVLILDGPLTEELYGVVEEWQNLLGEILTVHSNKENIGLTKSLNIGLGLVKCDFVARMDSDDVAVPARFDLQHDFLESNSSVDIVGGAMEMVGEDGQVKYVRYYPESHSQIVARLPKMSPFAHPAVMMRMSAFREKGLRYDERYRNSQDIVLWFDALYLGCGMANLHDIVLRFTESEEVYSRRGSVRAKNEFLGWMRGIKKNYGIFTFKYIYPCARYIIRSLPVCMISFYYNSKFYRKSYSRK